MLHGAGAWCRAGVGRGPPPDEFHAMLVANGSTCSPDPVCGRDAVTRGLGSVALLVGGEPARPSWSTVGFPRTRGGRSARRVMINAYGPTETTVYAALTASLTAGSPGPVRSVRPCPGTALSCSMLVASRQPGVVGELYVAGAGVSVGYVAAGGVDRRRGTSPSAAVRRSPGSTRVSRPGDLVAGSDGAAGMSATPKQVTDPRCIQREPGEARPARPRDAVPRRGSTPSAAIPDAHAGPCDVQLADHTGLTGRNRHRARTVPFLHGRTDRHRPGDPAVKRRKSVRVPPWSRSGVGMIITRRG